MIALLQSNTIFLSLGSIELLIRIFSITNSELMRGFHFAKSLFLNMYLITNP